MIRTHRGRRIVGPYGELSNLIATHSEFVHLTPQTKEVEATEREAKRLTCSPWTGPQSVLFRSSLFGLAAVAFRAARMVAASWKGMVPL
jgi:hypothetical protein